MVHPLKQEMLITIGLKSEDKINNIKYIFSNLIEIFTKMTFQNFI